ncbi:MAG: M56 family metallopeptidase [Clostridia bacterium]|nr:M56 family metallopeptidase [Clostridia bacterium]
MTDPVWVISSSVLILAVIAIRAILGKRMSAGLRYALWGLVLLRLLIPGTVFSSPVSVKSAVIKAPVVSDIEAVRRVSSVSMDDEGVVTGRLAGVKPPEEAYPYASSFAYPVELVLEEKATPERFESLRRTVEAREIMNIVWYCGMAALALRFIFANTRAYLDLRRRREPIPADAPCRVYAVDGISSSCLFMGAVYVSKQTAMDGHELKNVLAHELAHRRHGDGVTVFLRSAALILHWYNPLVWAAAYISRRDGELFADAGAIKALGEDERESYGMTLIGLSSKLKKRVGLSVAATTMTGGKRELKERITHMAKHTKTKLMIAAAVTALLLAALAFCFLGCKSNNPPNGKTNGPDKLFTYFIDIDHDGEAEEFTVDLEALGTEGHASPFITKNGEEIIRLDEFGTSHAGMVSYAHTELDGSDYILRYAPYLGGGTFSIGYELLELRNGELSVKEQDSFRLDNTGNEGMETAAERGAALIERVNELWKSSKLMISTDSFTLMRSGLFNIADGTPFETDGANVIAFSHHQIFTPEKGSRIVSFGEPVSYKEKLVVIDDFFTDQEDYHSAMTIAQKLEYLARFLNTAPTDEWVLDGIEESNYYAYMQAAADLLANGSLTPVYTCDVFFRLDDDALRAYAKRTELYRIRDDGQYEYSFEYSEPIAEYPREVGEKALNRLYADIADSSFVGPYTGAEGFVGDDWFVLKTVDDSMQDIQFSVIFHREGNEWHEFGDNNSQQDRPLFGACIVDENVGFLSYFTKFYDEPDGSYRKIWLYRTDDGGKTWVDMGLEIPEEYGNCYPGYAASPVFDGDHGVMQVCAFGLGSSGEETQYKGLWYETFDGGLTWTLRGDPDAATTPAPQQDIEFPSNEWLLEESWKLAEEVGRIHGVQFDKDEHDIRKSSIPSNNGYHGEVSINFFGDEANLWIYYVDDYSGNWPEHITMDMCRLSYDAYVDQIDGIDDDPEKWQRDREEFSWPTITVSRNELKNAGYDFSSDEEAADCAAAYYGDRIVNMFTGCSEDNIFRCYEAVNVEIAPNDFVLDYQTHLAWLAVRPVNEWIFSRGFGDILEALYGGDEYPECRGWFTIWYGINVRDMGDGSFSVTYNFDA